MAIERTRVVIIGAGQAGLSVAYYLRRFELAPGSDFIVYDRGPSAGGAWQHRWEALKLGSAHRVNDLPGMAEMGLSFETADRDWPARDIVAAYYGSYEQYYQLNVQRPVSVTGVENRGADLILRHSRGSTITQFLVNATGTWGSPFVPYYPGMRDFRGSHVHTADYVSAEQFRGQNVIVVGGGTSAIGFMLELEGVAASQQWVSRRPIDWIDSEHLDLEGASAAVAMQDEAARSGRALPSIVSGTGVPKSRRIAAGIQRGLLVARPMFDRIEPDGVRWDDGSFAPADAIIWATGFRPELRHLGPLRLREKAGGISVGNGASWTDPRIFLAGYGPQASTIGAQRAGRMIARQIVSML
ncbi:NAD(P)-binding domain-containing protein [Rathayibacter sp. YIM 133350]|uniref:NAD(P)-binding domain-containing protein n=1 Tax=Rathayibacter sp. YIM 133350 TaxID=3131992 RepID=UPI00307E725D